MSNFLRLAIMPALMANFNRWKTLSGRRHLRFIGTSVDLPALAAPSFRHSSSAAIDALPQKRERPQS
jgi:hypothetical protein